MADPSSKIDEYLPLWDSLETAGDHAKTFFSAIYENRKEADRKFLRDYYFFLILAGLLFLLETGQVRELSFLSIKITDIALVKWILLTVNSFVYYQGVCNLELGFHLRLILYAYVKRNLAYVYDHDLEPLMDPPTFFTLERFHSKRNDFTGKTALAFGVVTAIIYYFLPPIIIIAFLVLYISHWAGESTSWTIKILTSVLSIIILIRALIMFWLGLKEAG